MQWGNCTEVILSKLRSMCSSGNTDYGFVQLYWLQPFYDPDLSISLERNCRKKNKIMSVVVPGEEIVHHFSLNK